MFAAANPNVEAPLKYIDINRFFYFFFLQEGLPRWSFRRIFHRRHSAKGLYESLFSFENIPPTLGSVAAPF